jgi:hypothetical protein
MVDTIRIPRAASGTHILLCLLLLTVSLRAMIPVGYMPDPAALRQGVVRITLCTSTGAVSILQNLRDSVGGHGHDHTGTADVHAPAMDLLHKGHDHSGSQHAAGAECPFWAMAHLTMDLPPAAVAPLLAAIRDEAVRFLAPASLPPLPSAGPPLGSRAPPSA